MPPTTRFLPKGLTILHEDRDLIVVDKPVGLLTMGTASEKERTVFYALTDYVRKGDPKSRKHVFLVHRLDRETSGVLILAKTEDAKRTLKDHWGDVTKTYLAIVHGHMPQPSGLIESHLAEDTAYNVRSTRDTVKGRLARTAYRVLKETADYSLLEVTLLTGHKHQIRVHLSESGHPIVGDRKYNPDDRNHKRLALHALTISFKHPFHGRPCLFEAPVPGYFPELMGGWKRKSLDRPPAETSPVEMGARAAADEGEEEAPKRPEPSRPSRRPEGHSKPRRPAGQQRIEEPAAPRKTRKPDGHPKGRKPGGYPEPRKPKGR